MIYLTGFHAMDEALRSGSARGATLLVSAPGPRVKRMMDECGKAGVAVKRVQAAELERLAPGHRGAALALETQAAAESAIDLDDFFASLDGDSALVVMLDHIEDPHNLGAILRSADVFGADLVVLPERRAAKETDAVTRASAGASAWVPVANVPNLARALESLKEAGFWTYAASMDGQSLPDAELSGRVAIVMGAEGSGVSRLLKERCDGILSVPQYGHVDSLNVSVAAGILMYEARRRLGPPPGRKRG
ncbi:MAG: 23S rRNA (guanosine(2251)-2'-O)-methyltransferase RlmB [Spirochaetia bacterium]|nr:23S rRNA (guanosine(2251)-2'-O)-methyltransferase RlmB [Spirochaetia bacterium]